MKNILVFPCGSEIALEIYRSLKYSIHFHLLGASSVSDHGRFVYEDYLDGFPYITDPSFLQYMKEIVVKYQIDAIYPAMDSVIAILKNNEQYLNCKVIGSEKATVNICLSKSKTYDKLDGIVNVPRLYELLKVESFPVFCKPDIGYGSRGAKKIESLEALNEYALSNSDFIICQYLPGEEYTVDCFTDRHGRLLLSAPRVRKRVMNGISVDTYPYFDKCHEFEPLIQKINSLLKFRGAWFAQFKRNESGELFLLEVAARFAGSSSLFRACGVNFALLTLFDAFDVDVSIVKNDYEIEMDRALDNVFKISFDYDEIYVDYDDCLVMSDSKVNPLLIALIFQCRNDGKQVVLLTKHQGELKKELSALRLDSLFDKIIHISISEKKSNYISTKKAIFIDDSFAERKDVAENCHIPVFGLDMIDSLLKK